MSEHQILDNTLKKAAILKWIMCFNKGREDFEDDEKSGHLSTLCDDNIKCVWFVVSCVFRLINDC